MKIVDCFTFYNELDMLNYRLNVLYPYVDHFVIVEARETHAGNPKKLYFEENKKLFESFMDKIVHIIVELPYKVPNICYDKNEQWLNENFQRDSIKYGIDRLHLGNEDLITICDLDEIVDPQRLDDFRKGIYHMENYGGGITWNMDFYYYNLNCRSLTPWIRAKCVNYRKFKEMNPEKIRMTNIEEFPLIQKGGWHLSYFGDSKFIMNKLKEFAHQEYNNQHYNSEDYIMEKIQKCDSLFVNFKAFDKINISENLYLPPLYQTYLSKYYKKEEIPIYIYIHICCINDWYEIFNQFIFKIKNSGLYSKVSQIRCSVLGDIRHHKHLFDDPKISILFHSYDVQLREKKTINLLYKDILSMKNEAYILYLHTKGITNPQGDLKNNVNDWINYMCYFNIYQHETCLHLLSMYNGVGVNLFEDPSQFIPYHYSGNFWWSKASNIRKLDYILDNLYNSPEFWITRSEGPFVSLWNSNTHHYNDPYPSNLYENKGIKLQIIEKKKESKKIAFFDNQLNERGTSVNLFDYAYFNQSILKNKSYIFYLNNNPHNNPDIIAKFNQYFEHVIGLNSFHDIDYYLNQLSIPILYQIKGGWNDHKLSFIAKNCIHSIFTCKEPHGDLYVARSHVLEKYHPSIPILPHIIHLPNHDRNMRQTLQIPNDAIVFGGYGGKDSFNIKYVHDTIYKIAKENTNIYFLFANFNTFCEKLPNIIHLPTIIHLDEKVEFINTCDAMIWARKEGESFGMAIGEFSSKNKPIIATKTGLPFHKDILSTNALWYDNEHSLYHILSTFNPKIYQSKNRNMYQHYTPENVMKQFESIFLS